MFLIMRNLFFLNIKSESMKKLSFKEGMGNVGGKKKDRRRESPIFF